MHNFLAVCVLAVSFCLVVCVSATPEVTEEGAARAAVEQAKTSVTAVHQRAQSELSKATVLLERVESSKNQAAQASSHAATTATGNNEAEKIAQQIKSLFDAVDTSYSDAQGKLSTAVSTLTPFVEEAQGLINQPEIEIKANDGTTDDYTETNKEATTLKGKADTLDGKITAAITPVTGFNAKADEMEKKTKQAQLKEAHVSAIVAVAKISTMLGNADTTIGQIERNKNEVSGIVGEMQQDCTTELTQSNEVIKQQCQIANEALRDATGALENAKSAKAAIETQQGIAAAALTKVTAEKQEVSVAKNEARTAETCVRTAEQSLLQLTNALETSNNYLTSATNSKDNLKTAVSTATSATRPDQSLTNSQVKHLQRSVSAAVTEMQSIMGEADKTLLKTENHKQTVHDIVQEMQTLKTTAKIESNEINELCKNAESDLTKATGAVQRVKTEKEAMRQEKVIADAALTEVNKATEINKAQQQANTATSCLAKVKENLVQVRSALQTAESSVEKANDLKKKLMTVLSTTTTAPRTKKVKETEKSDPPVAVGTESDQKDTTTQPTLTNTEQPAGKEPLDQGDSSADKFKDTLINGAQNVPTTALTGGKAPAPGAKNDSAMTVSVPLLVALIASAVLQ